MLGETLPKLGQGDVRLGVHSPQDHRRKPLDPRRALVAPDPQGPDIPRRAHPRRPADRARDAHPEARRRLAARQPRVNRSHHPAAQVHRQRLRHAYRPPHQQTP